MAGSQISAGEILVDEQGRSTISGVLKVASVSTADDDRDQDLRSVDYLDAEAYPEFCLEASTIDWHPNGAVAIDGFFSLRTSPEQIQLEGEVIGVGRDGKGNEQVALITSGSLRWDRLRYVSHSAPRQSATSDEPVGRLPSWMCLRFAEVCGRTPSTEPCSGRRSGRDEVLIDRSKQRLLHLVASAPDERKLEYEQLIAVAQTEVFIGVSKVGGYVFREQLIEILAGHAQNLDQRRLHRLPDCLLLLARAPRPKLHLHQRQRFPPLMRARSSSFIVRRGSGRAHS